MISTKSSGIRHHIATVVEIVIKSLAESLAQSQEHLPTNPFQVGTSSQMTSEQVGYMRWVGEQAERDAAATEKEKNLKRKKEQTQHPQKKRLHKSVETISVVKSLLYAEGHV